MKKENNVAKAEISKRFTEIDTSNFPDFYNYKETMEKGLWVLWVAKEKLGIRKLTAEQIAKIIIDVKEISCKPISIARSFVRAGDKIHIYRNEGKAYFEIMKPGKDHLISQIKEGSTRLFYFEPDKRYTSRTLLSKNILDNLEGDLKIVDPYCGERTLDILSNVGNRIVRFLTRVENLRENERRKFLRELQDFKSEHQQIEFRNYRYKDIHDRYIISSDSLVILGHSIKDLGAKESFAIILSKDTSKNIVEALIENFNRRWKQSGSL